MICRLIPRRALARRLKVLFFAGFIFAIFHLLVIGIEYEAKILYTPEEEILHRVKRIHSTPSETPKTISTQPFKARIVIAKSSPATTTTSSSTTKSKALTTTSEEKCSAGRQVLFLKTHKTASTTLTNIFLRYAEKHRLLVGLPPERHWELGGYPGKFQAMAKLVSPAANEYQVIAHHFRYSSEVENVISDKTFKVTVLRDPIHNFESGFGFFRDYPYKQWLGDKPDIKKFLGNPNFYYNTSTPWHFRAKNYMAFDLGLEFDRDDPEYIKEAVALTNKRFDLIMITDKFEESVILLKDALCLTLKDIAFLRLKVRKENDRSSLDARMQNSIRNWNKLDTALYDHFMTVLDKKIEKYGRVKMAAEVEELKQKVEEWNKKCIEKYSQFDDKPWIARIKLKPKAGAECEKMSWGEVMFGDHLRSAQSKTMKSKMRAIQPQMSDLVDLLKQEQIKILGSEAVKFSSGNSKHK